MALNKFYTSFTNRFNNQTVSENVPSELSFTDNKYTVTSAIAIDNPDYYVIANKYILFDGNDAAIRLGASGVHLSFYNCNIVMLNANTSPLGSTGQQGWNSGQEHTGNPVPNNPANESTSRSMNFYNCSLIYQNNQRTNVLVTDFIESSMRSTERCNIFCHVRNGGRLEKSTFDGSNSTQENQIELSGSGDAPNRVLADIVYSDNKNIDFFIFNWGQGSNVVNNYDIILHKPNGRVFGFGFGSASTQPMNTYSFNPVTRTGTSNVMYNENQYQNVKNSNIKEIFALRCLFASDVLGENGVKGVKAFVEYGGECTTAGDSKTFQSVATPYVKEYITAESGRFEGSFYDGLFSQINQINQIQVIVTDLTYNNGNNLLTTFTNKLFLRFYNYSFGGSYYIERDVDTNVDFMEFEKTSLFALIEDVNVSKTSEQSSQLTGISISKTKTITVTESILLQDVYNYFRYWFCLIGQWDFKDNISCANGIIDLSDWTISFLNEYTTNDVVNKIKVKQYIVPANNEYSIIKNIDADEIIVKENKLYNLENVKATKFKNETGDALEIFGKDVTIGEYIGEISFLDSRLKINTPVGYDSDVEIYPTFEDANNQTNRISIIANTDTDMFTYSSATYGDKMLALRTSKADGNGLIIGEFKMEINAGDHEVNLHITEEGKLLTVIRNKIDELKTSMTQQESDLKDVKGKITELATSTNEIAKNTETLTEDISAVQTDVDDIQLDMVSVAKTSGIENKVILGLKNLPDVEKAKYGTGGAGGVVEDFTDTQKTYLQERFEQGYNATALVHTYMQVGLQSDLVKKIWEAGGDQNYGFMLSVLYSCVIDVFESGVAKKGFRVDNAGLSVSVGDKILGTEYGRNASGQYLGNNTYGNAIGSSLEILKMLEANFTAFSGNDKKGFAVDFKKIWDGITEAYLGQNSSGVAIPDYKISGFLKHLRDNFFKDVPLYKTLNTVDQSDVLNNLKQLKVITAKRQKTKAYSVEI